MTAEPRATWDKDVQDIADQLVFGCEFERGVGYVGELADLIMAARLERDTAEKQADELAAIWNATNTRKDATIAAQAERLVAAERVATAAEDKHNTAVRQSEHLEAPAVNDFVRDCVKELACGCELPMYPEDDFQPCAAYMAMQEEYRTAHEREVAALAAFRSSVSEPTPR